MAKAKSLARQIAELDGPLPRDIDPEEDAPVQESDEESGSDDSEDDLAGTEHYESIGKSKLRKPAEVALGPEYAGSRVSRDALMKDDEDNNISEEENYSKNEGDEDNDTFAASGDVDMEDDWDIDSDAAFGERDDEKFKEFAFGGSSAPRINGSKKRATAADFMSDSKNDYVAQKREMFYSAQEETDENILRVNKQHSEQEESDGGYDDGSHDSTGSTNDEDDMSQDGETDTSDVESDEDRSEDDRQNDKSDEGRRAELREIMNEEQKSVIATISQAAKSDAAKGNAVKQQKEAYGSLVSIRMMLQKALIATNSMATVKNQEDEAIKAHPYHAAEEAAVKLWNTLDGIRHQLSISNNSAKSGQKRKLPVDASTTLSTLWDRMQASEIAALDTRQSTLEKWSAKVRSGTAAPVSRKLNPTAGQQSITSVLQDHFANSENLVRKTKIPHSCAPIQRDQKVIEDPDIYDDATFYQSMLKEFVDQKRMDALATPALVGEGSKLLQITALKEVKSRKNVDTKASKGRKLKYTVHEKLQNFMAPEDRGSWEQEAVDRFFGTLLGQKMTLREEDEDERGNGEEGGMLLEDEGLMLFRS